MVQSVLTTQPPVAVSWPVFGVSLSSQLPGSCGDLDLEVGCRPGTESVAVDLRALWPGGRARGSVLDQCEPVGGWPRCAAGEQFTELMGLRRAGSEVTRLPGGCGPGEQAVVPLGLVKRVGGEAQQDRLDDRGVVEDCRGYRAGLDPLRPGGKRVVDRQHEFLPVFDVGGCGSPC